MQMTGLYAGVSGLDANMTELSVIGNNIANVNTVGFKTGNASFEDVLSQTVSDGSGSSQIGLGVQVSGVQTDFSQGSFQTTGNTLDMAISGNGFFIVKDPTIGSSYYTRNGQFQTDKNSYIVNSNGQRVQGYMANSTGVLQNQIQDLQVNTNTVAANPTSNALLNANLDSNSPITGFVFNSGVNDTVNLSINGGSDIPVSLVTDGGLASGQSYDGGSVANAIKQALESKAPGDVIGVSYDDQSGKFTVTNTTGNPDTLTLDWTNGSSTASSLLGFNTNSTMSAGQTDTSNFAAGAFTLSQAGNTSDFSTPVTVYDSLGNSHVITVYFRKASLGTVGNNWNWYAVVGSQDSVDGKTEVAEAGTLTFNSSGSLYSATNTVGPYYGSSGLTSNTTGGFNFTGGALQSQLVNFNFGDSIAQGSTGTDGTTQYATSSGVSKLTQDGYASGTLQSLNVGQNGIITGIFSNGQNLTLGQVLVADFPSPDGLASVGNNNYQATNNSGQPLIGSAGSSGRGLIQSSTLEQSNVDLASEFVSMIAAQRGFEANSKIITTTDQILADLVNLKT